MYRIDKILCCLKANGYKLLSITYGKKVKYKFSINENININIVVKNNSKEIMDLIDKYSGLDQDKFFQEMNYGSRS